MASERVKCLAPRRGVVDLRCELDSGHEGWHKAVFTDRREIVYDGAHHFISITETVTWEPLEALLEAVRAGIERRGATTDRAAMPGQVSGSG